MLCLNSWMTYWGGGGAPVRPSASVWLRHVRGCLRAQRLLLVYERQQEKCDVMRAPVARVRGHRRPIAALHQALSQLKVHPLLQLHWKTEDRRHRALRIKKKKRPICLTTAVLTGGVSGGGGGPSYGGEPVR